MKYSKASREFTLNGKKVTKNSKNFLKGVCEYVIENVGKGLSIVDVVDMDNPEFPLIGDILGTIDTDKDLAELMSKAESTRLSILKEKMLRAADSYRNMPNDQNKDIFVALEKTYTSLKKSQQESGTVIIKFNQVLPNNFWDERTVVAPEHPLVPKEERKD